MKKQLIRKITAAAMAFAMIGAAVSAPVDKSSLLGSIFTAFAETSTATFDESTGVLTLHGNFEKEDLYDWKATADTIVFDEGTVFPEDCSYMFFACLADEIDLSNVDTSKVTNMEGMFNGCYAESINLSGIDTSNVTNMSHMFIDCNHLKSLDLSGIDTSNVTDMSLMFYFCYCLEPLDLSSFDTSNVTDMEGMFLGCESLESLNLSNFDTSNVTNTKDMFEDCKNLKSINLSSFDTSNVTDMKGMFFDCKNLKSLDVTGLDTSNVTDMSNMFYGCSSLESIDVTGFDTSNAKDNSNMFGGPFGDCTALDPSICIVKGNSVTLDGNIGVNVYLQPCENLAKVVMSGPNGDRVFTDFTGITQDSGYYKFSYPINATQGSEQITLKAYDKDGNRLIVCDNNYGLFNHSQVECTVYGYIDQIKRHEMYSASTLAALVDGLENYCKAAENYFNGTDNTIAGIENVTADSVKKYETDLGSDVKLSLVLNSAAALRIYTESDDVLIDGEKATAKYKGVNKYYEISNICAQKLSTPHKITIDGTDYKCSALSYVHRVLNNQNAKNNTLLTEMAKATYVYAMAAEAYVGKPYQRYAKMTPKQIVEEMTLEQKAAQMVQSIAYMTSDEEMQEQCFGSVYGDAGMYSSAEWRELVDGFQQGAVDSETGIPYIMALDDVHGLGYCRDAVYFPHNIGQGAANDEELAYQVGRITADESKLCHLMWNLYPCVAQSVDPRWGRTYECYSSDLDIITRLSTAYTKGLIDGGVIACAKHFFGDGNVVYGTGEQTDYPRIMDRGDSQLTEEEIDELLKVYQAQIDAGVQTIMVSFSSLNGVKMHENGEYIWKLKNEMGFEGFIISDYQAIEFTSPETYEDQVASAINSGIDMLMEADRYDDARKSIIDAVRNGKISEERINDAVERIIKVKQNAGIFDDPFCENIETVQQETGSMEYRAVAEKLVEKSLVLLKNENETLPIKEGTKVYITGPSADNPRVQCGGWTMGWVESPTKNISGVTTILEAFERYAEDYGIEVITDPEQAENADVVLLCIGETSYAEWYGDTTDLELCGMLGLNGNREAIDEAKALDKPTVTCIVAGRQVILDEEDYNNWDSVVMCYLPGSEGKGVSDVICGCSDFTGRLPEPWYGSVEQIGTDENVFGLGYGLSYPEGFVPRTEPEAIPDPISEDEGFDAIAEGTNYTKGVFENGVYSNEYAGITADIPDDFSMINEVYLSMIAENTIEGSSTEEEMIYNSAVIWDDIFENGFDAAVTYKFVNTTMGFPDNPQCTEEEYLDHIKSFDTYWDEAAGITHTYKDRSKVVLGGNEYTREEYRISAGDEYSEVFAYYVRRLDDNLMCIIEVETLADSSEFLEAWFN
ncbi:BspA family leucine-rich repeat surface protein [Ruminococcus sp.]|uniref:BspA family leucine-rich repeat surface protein n=1 Tax=Ruminococcus sp. TaxID=41978 RepID=UPI001B4A57A3|nr:BspA family leucine-rich repeat surface protein [Ruminococcus sp.]MBP5432594.1 BspA family leucine-rich repeat surface protein [Ruminococcus sp.]